MLSGIKKNPEDTVSSRRQICNTPAIEILHDDMCIIYNSECLDAQHEKVLMASNIELPSDFQNLRNKVTF